MDETTYQVIVLRVSPEGKEQIYEAEYEPDEGESEISACASALEVALGGIKED